MSSSDLAVWMTRTELACEPPLLARYVALLSQAERARHAAFRSDAARTDFVIGRALLRCALSHATDAPPQLWRFTTNPFGRPQLVRELNPRDLRFNLSHTDGLIACVVAVGRDVGIDVECTEQTPPVAALARRFLTAEDAEDVVRTPAARRRSRFFELWTLHESRVKARGTGLGTRLEPLDTGRWRSWLLHPTPAHTLALTAEVATHEPADLHLLHMVPLAA